MIAIKMQQIGDRPGSRAIVKQTNPTANHHFATFPRRVGEANPWRNVMQNIVEIILPVITGSRDDRKIRADTVIVLDKPRNYLFEKRDVRIAGLNQIRIRMSALVVRETGKGIYSLRIAQILKSPPADVGNVHAKLDFMLAANISHHVSAVEMTFGTPQSRLRSS